MDNGALSLKETLDLAERIRRDLQREETSSPAYALSAAEGDALRLVSCAEFGELIKSAREALTARQGAGETAPVAWQSSVNDWMQACFGPEVSADKLERNDRFVEESLELAQATGYSRERAHALVDYVFDRPAGEPFQEVGGVMLTLTALCLANDIDVKAAGDAELARVWTKIDKIRAKQAAKPTGSALPITHPSPPADAGESGDGELEGLIRKLETATGGYEDFPLIKELALAFGGFVYERRDRDRKEWFYPVGQTYGRRGLYELPRYTASIDAAVALVERKLGRGTRETLAVITKAYNGHRWGDGFQEVLSEVLPRRIVLSLLQALLPPSGVNDAAHKQGGSPQDQTQLTHGGYDDNG